MIDVLFFASIREALGVEKTQLDAEGLATVADVVEKLRSNGPQWADALSGGDLLCSVNQELVSLDAALQDGDELGLFPPVTGG